MSKGRPNPSFRCEKCGGNRWRTIAKGAAWRCRKCGFVRNRKEADS